MFRFHIVHVQRNRGDLNAKADPEAAKNDAKLLIEGKLLDRGIPVHIGPQSSHFEHNIFYRRNEDKLR